MHRNIIIDDFKATEKGGAFFILAEKVDFTLKLFNDQFWNAEAKTNAFSVDALLFMLDCAKHLEHAALVFSFYPKAIVCDWYSQKSLLKLSLNVFTTD